MESTRIIRVADATGSTLCVSSEDGDRLYGLLSKHLNESKRVELSFDRVDNLTSAFLNAAIGQLYGEFPEDHIRANLRIANMAQSDLQLLKNVVETAKAYFNDRERFDEARREVFGYDDE